MIVNNVDKQLQYVLVIHNTKHAIMANIIQKEEAPYPAIWLPGRQKGSMILKDYDRCHLRYKSK